MTHYLRTWTFMRVLRLAGGILIIVQAVQTKQWLFVALGALFALLPILNIGCCGIAGCPVPLPKNNEPSEIVIYEEVR